jgi:cytochrome c biogenesis protein CcmG/thiol:disulfide interchange protein DsbE
VTLVTSMVLLAALMALLAYGVLAKAPDTSIDDDLARARPSPAPDFRLEVLRSGRLGTSLTPRVGPVLRDGWVQRDELRGIPYVLNFWASWCVPCREEARTLEEEWRAARRRGVLFVGLDMQDLRSSARQFLDEFGVDYLNIRDPTDATAKRYGLTGIPETYFISARGDVVGHVIGVVTAAQLRDGIVATIRGTPSAAEQGGAQKPAR